MEDQLSKESSEAPSDLGHERIESPPFEPAYSPDGHHSDSLPSTSTPREPNYNNDDDDDDDDDADEDDDDRQQQVFMKKERPASAEPPKATHQSQTPANGKAAQQRSKSAPKKKYGFRLSPEEQELSYELKASMMRKLNHQTDKINNELDMHKKLKELKKQQRGKSATGQQDKMSQTNAVKLMRMYEKKAKEAEARVKGLESELEESQALTRRYRDMYVIERDRSRPQTSTRSNRPNNTPRTTGAAAEPKQATISENSSDSSETRGNSKTGAKSSSKHGSSEDKKDRITEDELDDDEALFKRHIAKIAEMKAMHTTSPIRIEDIIRKSEVLILENDSLKREVQRLKRDNADLIRRSKNAMEEKSNLLLTISTSEAARAELTRRLDMERKNHQKLQNSLTRQASDWVQARKEYAEMEEKRRWHAVGPVSPYDAESRALSHPVKKNIYMPRKMYPVESYSGSNHTR